MQWRPFLNLHVIATHVTTQENRIEVDSHKSTLRINSSSPTLRSMRVQVAPNVFIIIYHIIWCIVIRPLAVCGHPLIDGNITQLISDPISIFNTKPLSTIRHWDTRWAPSEPFIENLGRQCVGVCVCWQWVLRKGDGHEFHPDTMSKFEQLSN